MRQIQIYQRFEYQKIAERDDLLVTEGKVCEAILALFQSANWEAQSCSHLVSMVRKIRVALVLLRMMLSS